MRPDRVAGDKGYSSPAVRQYLKNRRIGAVIPIKANEAPDPGFDRAAYRERNVVERLINRLKQWRRIATRYEKRAGQLPRDADRRLRPALAVSPRAVTLCVELRRLPQDPPLL